MRYLFIFLFIAGCFAHTPAPEPAERYGISIDTLQGRIHVILHQWQEAEVQPGQSPWQARLTRTYPDSVDVDSAMAELDEALRLNRLLVDEYKKLRHP